jgi:chemotaxis protein histidine kinase CheA
MNLEPAPRLKKIPFIAAAVACSTGVLLIALFAPNKFAPLPFLSAVGLLILSIVAFMIPLLTDYAADSAEYVQEERTRANDQVQRLHTASESLARAAAQIKAVEEAVHKTAHAAETLPYRMQEKLVEFNAALAEKEEGEHESLEEELAELRAANSDQLKAVAEKIQKALADWATLEAASRKQFAATEAAVTKVQNSAGDSAAKFETRLNGLMAALDAKLAKLERSPSAAENAVRVAAAVAEPPPVETPKTAPAHETAPAPLVESVAVVENNNPKEPSPFADGIELKKNRPRRKSRPEDTLTALSEPSASGASGDEPSADEFTFPHEAAKNIGPAETPRSSEPAESAASSDGATRLLATAYIGIGNKLFIRGEGPGLSWEKGVPMQFVSIGKWGWATNDALSPVRCELYKNDETAALTGEVVLDPGRHVEITALF